MAHQHRIDDFVPEKACKCEAKVVHEASGTVRLKVSSRVAKELGLPDKGDFKAVVRGEKFKSRYDTTAGLRLRIPNHYAYLFNGDGCENNGEVVKAVEVDLWVEDGMLYMAYKPDDRIDYYENPQSFKQPNYERGDGFCSRCESGFKLKRLPRAYCPECNIKLRENPRKGRGKRDVKRIDLDFDDLDSQNGEQSN
ncbi:hypothetical protein HRbin01_00198 [archaeon HR01]|nr:hypothetical protein HRbin01_00198 [archaeon HR01]